MSNSNVYCANVAKAKIIYNKNNETYRIVVAFNVFNVNKNGQFLFPPQSKCHYVSGDICYEDLDKDKNRIIEQAKQQLRTNEIVFV